MASTLAQLKTRAREKTDQVGSTFISEPELTTLINLGFQELYDLVVVAFEDYFTLSTTLTLSTGTTVALPSNFYKLRGLDYNNNGSYEALREFQFNERNMGQARNLHWSRGYQIDRRYRIVGDNLLLQPDGSAVGSYRLWYVPMATPLALDTDTIPEALSKFGWDEYIVLFAAERMLTKEESSTTDILTAKAAMTSRILTMAANRQIDQSETVQDVRGDWDEY